MRIAVWHNLPSGGGKRALYYHVRGLLKRGHDVETWCPPTADLSYLPLSDLVREHVVELAVRQRESRIPGLRFVRHYQAMLDPLHAMEDHCRSCAAEIERGRFDLLFANSSYYPLGAAPIGRLVHIPRVLYLQEPTRRMFEARPQLPWIPTDDIRGLWPRLPLKRYLADYLRTQAFRIEGREESRNILAYDQVLVNSYFSRENLVRSFDVDASVCYLGVDTLLFRDAALQREDFVLGMGRLAAHKNPALLLDAVSRLAKPRPRVVWVGDDASPAFQRQVEQQAREGEVDLELRIRVDDLELVNLLNRTLALVYLPKLEPFGYGPLEANACGAPVIGAAEGGVRETIEDGVNGLLVEPRADAVANAIERLRREPRFARLLGEQGRKLVETRWQLEPAIDRLEGHLRRVTSRGRLTGTTKATSA